MQDTCVICIHAGNAAYTSIRAERVTARIGGQAGLSEGFSPLPFEGGAEELFLF